MRQLSELAAQIGTADPIRVRRRFVVARQVQLIILLLLEAVVRLDICVVVREGGAYRVIVKHLFVVDGGLRDDPGLHEGFVLLHASPSEGGAFVIAAHCDVGSGEHDGQRLYQKHDLLQEINSN